MRKPHEHVTPNVIFVVENFIKPAGLVILDTRRLELDLSLDLVWIHLLMFAAWNMLGIMQFSEKWMERRMIKGTHQYWSCFSEKEPFRYPSLCKAFCVSCRLFQGNLLRFFLLHRFNCSAWRKISAFRYHFGTFISPCRLMISRPQQMYQAWRVQTFWTRGMKHQQEMLVVCRETEEEVDLYFP